MSHSDTRPNVVFVVGHPDDVPIFFGGTAWLLKDRYRLHVLCASKGERGYSWTGPGPTPPSAEVGATRAREEAASCALLGAELTFLGQIDGEIFAGREVCEKVGGLLKEIQPAAVFTHGPLCKADHSATFGMALQALHLTKLFWTTELYMVLHPGGDTYYGHYADVYVNISSVIEEKRRLIRFHQRHAADAEVEHYVEGNRLLGRLSWCDYAEAYQTALAPVAERWKRKAGSILMDLPVSAGG